MQKNDKDGGSYFVIVTKLPQSIFQLLIGIFLLAFIFRTRTKSFIK